MNAPKVSIVSVSYNQEKFIKQALDGFVGQNTNFEFEVIICDDSSTDKTQDIIREYAAKYPAIFKPLLRKKNIGIQKNVKSALMRATGEYIALCEGDDFWIDSDKLQKQADFLDNHPGCGLVFHPVKVLFEDGKQQQTEIYPALKNRSQLTYKRLLESNFIQTNSVMYRRMTYDSVPTNILPMDWYLHLMHAKGGQIGFLNDVMGVYRRHEQGVWWESHTNISYIWRRHGIGHLNVYQALLDIVGDNKTYRMIINGHITAMLNNIFDLEDASDIQDRVTKEFPSYVGDYVSNLRKKYLEAKSHLEQVVPRFESLKTEHAELQAHASGLQEQLNLIQSSRVWKARNKVARIVHNNRKTKSGHAS